jgi:glycosyltransferase involved in cell wall biosynthesis
MPDSPALTTIIIPTLAERSRLSSLTRAVESARISSRFGVDIIVVVNGDRACSDVVAWLSAAPRVKLHFSQIGSAPLAVLEGRKLVKTPYFAMLDDDDEYLEGAIDERMRPFLLNPQCEVSISNGLRTSLDGDVICFRELQSISRDPLLSLLRQNWLASCGALFRTEAIGVEYFEDYLPYLEWTWLAFRLCVNRKVVEIVDIPTFRIHESVGSLSKSRLYMESHELLYKRMLSFNLDPTHRKLVRAKCGHALHDLANYYGSAGLLFLAWRAHIKSLFYPQGWKYILFSRRLIVLLMR